jgi:signal transduction histidine kinase
MAFAQVVIKINGYHWFYIFSSILFSGIIFLDLGLGNLFLFTTKPIFSFLSVFILVTLFFFFHTQFLRQFLKGQKNERFFSIYFKFLNAFTLLVFVYWLFLIIETYLSKTNFELPLLFIRINLAFYILYTLLIILLIFNDLIDKKLIFSNLSVLFVFSFRVVGGIFLLLEYIGFSKNMAFFNRTYLDFFYPITLTLNSAFMLGFVIEIVGIFIIIAYRVLKIYHQNAENLLRNSQDRINNFSALMMGIEQERQRIAQDLHDGLGVLLSTIKMKISIENETEQSQSKLKDIMGDIDIALEDMRGISRNLMPITLSKLGFNRAIEELIQNLRISNPNLDIELIKIVDNERLIEPVGVNLYRIIQELLQNVLKHSNASELIIQLFCRDDVFVLMVEDNGIGFDVDNKKVVGIGLENVKYRTVSMQGQLSIDSFKGKGTTITVEIPLKKVYLD